MGVFAHYFFPMNSLQNPIPAASSENAQIGVRCILSRAIPGMESNPIPVPLRKQSPCLKAGFTLVELLVVIVIIAVLASVAIFATRGVRKKAMQVNAMSALREIAAGSIAYAAENNGDINTMRWAGDPKEGGGGQWVSNTFWGRLQPYLFADVSETNQNMLKKELSFRLDRLFKSTDADTMAGTFVYGAKIYHDTSGLTVPVGFNSNLHQWGKFLKVSSFNDPSQVIYFTYGFGFFNEEDGKSYAPVPSDKSMPKNNIYYFDNKTMAALFLDGHMEILNPPIPKRRFE